MADKKVKVIRSLLLPIFILLFGTLSIVKDILFTIGSFFIPWTLRRVVRTPEDRFKGLEEVGYTFKSNYVELPIGGGKTLPRVHYVDEGPRDAKETILCLHGEPTWSFLYRKMIHVFVDAGYRVIAPDFIGFGKSDKYTHLESYTLDLHTHTLRSLLDHLKVKNLTLVCQDWGGKVGLPIVKDVPYLFSRLVILNTSLPVGLMKSDNIPKAIQSRLPFIFWRIMCKFFGVYLPVGRLLKVAMKNPTAAVINGYCAPFPSHLYKAGVAQWPLLVPLTSTTLVATEFQETIDFLSTEWKGKTFIMFADGDIINFEEFYTFKKILPNADTKIISNAGHFLQEDKGEDLAHYIINFVNDKTD